MRLVMGVMRPDRRAGLRARRSPRARPAEVREDPPVIEAYLGVARRTRPTRCSSRSTDAARATTGASRPSGASRFERRRGTDRHPHRRQRRGQDHHPEDASPGCATPRAGSDHASTGEDIAGLPAHAHGGARASCQSPRGAGSSRPVGAGEPGDGRLRPHGPRPRPRTPTEHVFDAFPRLRERASQAGGHAVRRRAADAGDRPGADGQAAAAAAGRAVDGPRPAAGRSRSSPSSREINGQGTTILLVEQNAQQALAAADTAYILETGQIVREGTGAELAGTRRVRARVPRRRRLTAARAAAQPDAASNGPGLSGGPSCGAPVAWWVRSWVRRVAAGRLGWGRRRPPGRPVG